MKTQGKKNILKISKDLINSLSYIKEELKRQSNTLTFSSSIKKEKKIDQTMISQISLEERIHTETNEPETPFSLGQVSDFLQGDLALEILQKKAPITLQNIRSNIIGLTTRYDSLFRPNLEAVYVDHTATNRAYKMIQKVIQYVKMYAANPHTEYSHFGAFSTQMMHISQEILLKVFSADPKEFVALPVGSGSTGAIEKTIKLLKYKGTEDITIFVTPYEHHSNTLPWVQSYKIIKTLACDQIGNLSIDLIEEQLLNCESNNIIVSVSAASNVTSTLTDLKRLNKVIRNVRKSKETIFAVDCAAYCCHKELNLQELDQIDFVYLSPHKNLGGAEACGVIVARKSVMKNAKPTFPGGGTVAFVKGYTQEDIMYDRDIFNREIAGTPPFIGFYRAALSFELLKNEIGYEYIHQREEQNTKRFLQIINEANNKMIQKDTKIVVYGSQDFKTRANVITFNIISKGKVLHHHLVSLMLTEFFGIQLRSGCFCAGQYGIKLLKLDEKTVNGFKDEVSAGIMKNKPGYLRLDLTFYLEDYEIDYVANSISAVAQNSQSVGLFYKMQDSGQITRNKKDKENSQHKFSLKNAHFAEEVVKNYKLTHYERLTKRKATLEKQYQEAMRIIGCSGQVKENSKE